MKNALICFLTALVLFLSIFESKYFSVAPSLPKEHDVRLGVLRSIVRIQNNVERRVGSGVLIRSSRVADNFYVNTVLTNQHIVGAAPQVSVEDFSYLRNKSIMATHSFNGSIYKADPKEDLALVNFFSTTQQTNVAPLASKYSFDNTCLTDDVTVGGCGMGFHPFLTRGLVSSFDVDKDGYFLISAPAIGGNSGGGAFNSAGQLLGIVSRIGYLQENATDIPVTHITFVKSMDKIREWLNASGFITYKRT